jgi:hypothetical protein
MFAKSLNPECIEEEFANMEVILINKKPPSNHLFFLQENLLKSGLLSKNVDSSFSSFETQARKIIFLFDQVSNRYNFD